MKTLLLLLSAATMLRAAEKPNITLIVTDDHGYADLSCQGYESDIRTPHLDRIAKEDARFTDGYVTAPQCCPSRAGLLTGRDQNRFEKLQQIQTQGDASTARRMRPCVLS